MEVAVQVVTATIAIYAAILATLNYRAQRDRDRREAEREARQERPDVRVEVSEEWHQLPFIEVLDGRPSRPPAYRPVLRVTAANHRHREVYVREVSIRTLDGHALATEAPAYDERTIKPSHAGEYELSGTKVRERGEQVVPVVTPATGHVLDGAPISLSTEPPPGGVVPPSRASW